MESKTGDQADRQANWSPGRQTSPWKGGHQSGSLTGKQTHSTMMQRQRCAFPTLPSKKALTLVAFILIVVNCAIFFSSNTTLKQNIFRSLSMDTNPSRLLPSGSKAFQIEGTTTGTFRNLPMDTYKTEVKPPPPPPPIKEEESHPPKPKEKKDKPKNEKRKKDDKKDNHKDEKDKPKQEPEKPKEKNEKDKPKETTKKPVIPTQKPMDQTTEPGDNPANDTTLKPVKEGYLLQNGPEGWDGIPEEAKHKSCVDHHGTLIGKMTLDKTDKTIESVISVTPFIQEGGSFTPKDCVPKEKTAIVIPFRNRTSHLYILLYNLLPMLHRQRIDFTIFVVEQDDFGPFNRGMMLNIGFLEASKIDNFTCFIFHDVDLLPLSDYNWYHCNNQPTHMVAGMNKYGYKLNYDAMFGGVEAFKKDQYLKMNGASNLYFGWGAEDDDLFRRIYNSGMKRVRKYKSVGLYDMFKHKVDRGNERNKSRQVLLKAGTKRQKDDGLSTIKYERLSLERLSIYTWIKVHVDMKEVLKTAPGYLKKEMEKMAKQAHITKRR